MRGRNEGGIRQRPNGKWEGRISGGIDSSGNRIRTSVYGDTKAEVLNLIALARLEAGKGFAASNRITVPEWLDTWLSTDVSKLRYKTQHSYTYTVEKHLRPHFQNTLLSKLTPGHIDGLLRDLKNKGFPPASVRYAAVVLKIAVRAAARKQVLPSNPFADVRLEGVPGKKKKMVTWTMEEALNFFSVAKSREDRLHAFYKVGVFTGLRHGELLALRWKDINFQTSTLTVEHTLEEKPVDGFIRYSLQPVKTKESEATIFIPKVAVEALKSHRLAMFKEGMSSEFVFVTRNGTHYSKSNVHKAFNINIAEAGVPKIRIHDLRHTCATLLLESGESMAKIQHQLRHSDPAITARLYAHVTPKMKRETADAMEKIFEGEK